MLTRLPPGLNNEFIMSLALNLLNSIEGYSRAKYSTWFYFRPDNTLFDAGEGVSTTLSNRIYGVERILISHGHGDHIGGIPGFLFSRASSMGDVEKPLEICYPKGDRNVQKMISYVQGILRDPPFELTWRGLSPGDRIDLPAENRFVDCFPTEHIRSGISLGYRILETRNRLRHEYRDFSQSEIVERIREIGREAMSETYDKPLFIYGGDSMPIPTHYVEGAEVLLHDATFLFPEDRQEKTHATVEEAVEVARKAGVKGLLLFHLSTRYRRSEIRKVIQEVVSRSGLKIPVVYSFPRGLPTNLQTVD